MSVLNWGSAMFSERLLVPFGQAFAPQPKTKNVFQPPIRFLLLPVVAVARGQV